MPFYRRHTNVDKILGLFKTDQIGKDVKTAGKGLVMTMPPYFIYSQGKNAASFVTGKKTFGEYRADTNSNLKYYIGGNVGGAALVVGAGRPALAAKTWRLYQSIMSSEPGLYYNAIDYFNDLQREHRRDDLEFKDFLFYLLPELIQHPIKRYTYWDASPQVLDQIIGPAYEEAERKMLAAGVPIKKKKSSSKKSSSKRKKCPAGYYWNRKQQKCLKSKF